MYNFETTVDYNDNFSYRNVIRKLFSLKTIDQQTDIDVETADENDYDEELECISNLLDLRSIFSEIII